MPDFPLYNADEWHHPNGFHMAGEVYLTAQGQLRADLTTWTTSWGLGFTGGCLVSVIDSGANLLHKWLIHPLGVDARAVWWSRSRRSDHPEEAIDPGLAAQAERIEVLFSHMPQERWNDILADISKRYEDLKIFVEQLSQ